MINLNYPSFVRFEKCEDEPIHQIGQIQSFGAILTVDIHTQLIIQVSNNIDLFLLKNIDEILTTPITDYLPDFSVSFFDNPSDTPSSLSVLREYRISDILTSGGKQQMYVRVFVDNSNYVIELEHIDSLEDNIKSFEMVNMITESIQKAKSQANLFQLFTDYVSQWLSYDRVMIFKYDKEFNGEVVAESLRNENLQSFLHHHFPPKDIPKQAREMLALKKIRLIEDVRAKTIALHPYIPIGKDDATNLFLSETRNPSEIHLQYLKNMSVTATLTCIIFYKQKVWGLLCCQHLSGEKYIYQKTRSLLLSATNIFSKNLENVIVKENNLLFSKKLHHLRAIKEKLFHKFSLSYTFLHKNTKSTLQLFDATGVAIVYDDKCLIEGTTPERAIINDLVHWISQQNYNKYFCIREFPMFKGFSIENYQNQYSGFLAIEISKINKEYIIWFRPAIQETFKMIGGKYTDFDEQLSPRSTFQSWLKEVKDKCERWTQVDLDVADVIYQDLLSVLHFKNTKLKKMNRRLKKMVDELRVSQNTLRWLYNSDKNASYFIDNEYKILALNKQAISDIFKLVNKKDVINTNILDYVQPLQVQTNKFLDSIQKVWQGEFIFYKDTYNYKNNTYFVNISMMPVYNDLFEMIGVGITIIQITESLKQNKKILELSTAMDKVSDLMLIINKLGEVVWSNQTFIEFVGYSFAEIDGNTIFNFLMSENTDANVLEQLKNALDKEEHIQLQMLNINKEKEEYWVSLELHPIKNTDEQTTTFICLQKIIMFEINK